jgi:hypothetical protein
MDDVKNGLNRVEGILTDRYSYKLLEMTGYLVPIGKYLDDVCRFGQMGRVAVQPLVKRTTDKKSGRGFTKTN